eukprot:4544691-Pyramimonas_sp.AAC.1
MPSWLYTSTLAVDLMLRIGLASTALTWAGQAGAVFQVMTPSGPPPDPSGPPPDPPGNSGCSQR